MGHGVFAKASHFLQIASADERPKILDWIEGRYQSEKRGLYCPGCSKKLYPYGVAAFYCPACTDFWLEKDLAKEVMDQKTPVAIPIVQDFDSISAVELARLAISPVPPIEGLSKEKTGTKVGPIFLLAILMILIRYYASQNHLENFIVFFPRDPLKNHGLNFFVSTISHIGKVHLSINLLSLVAFGYVLERQVEEFGAIKIFFISALGANLLEAIFSGYFPHPCLGASGGIAGMMMAITYIEPTAYTRLFTWNPVSLSPLIINVPFAAYSIVWLVTEIYHSANAILGENPTHIDYFAHVAGAILGFTVVFTGFVRKMKEER